MSTNILSKYEQAAQEFLSKHNLEVQIVEADPQASPAWAQNEQHGTKYQVTIRRTTGDRRARISFAFWGSISDMRAGEDPTAYDILACVNSDLSYAGMSPDDIAAELGYDTDSISQMRQLRAVARFSDRLAAFFTADEQEDLQEIS